MISDTHRRLREETRDDHQMLEDRVQILSRIQSPGTRQTLVAQFHRLHTEIEAAVLPWLSDHPGLDFPTRRRSPALAADMRALGIRAPASAQASIRAGGVPEALGLMYVVEGSTLGGRVIRREASRLGVDMRGLSFLDPYGDSVGERWKDFLAVLETAARSPADTGAMVAGAQAGFRHAALRLCETVDV